MLTFYSVLIIYLILINAKRIFKNAFLLKENIKLLEFNTLVKRQYLPHIDQVKVSMVTRVVNRTFLSLHEGSITPEVPL